MSQKNDSNSFGKEQLKFLLKIKSYENKNELNRFLLIVSFGGLLSIIAGFLELVFYEFLDTDVLFFQYDIVNNPKPILLFAVWILTIFPVLIILIFTTGTSGIINWNRTYRFISVVAIICYFTAEGLIVFLGKSKTEFIPIIWGVFIFLGFLLASVLILKLEKQSKVALLLLVLGIIVLIDSILSYVIFSPKEVMFYMLTGFGIIMTASAGSIYLLEEKYGILDSVIAKADD